VPWLPHAMKYNSWFSRLKIFASLLTTLHAYAMTMNLLGTLLTIIAFMNVRNILILIVMWLKKRFEQQFHLLLIPFVDQLANVFTKALKFRKLVSKHGVLSIHTPT